MDVDEERRLVEAVVLTPEQEASIDEALRDATEPEDEDVAVSARYDPALDTLIMELKTGQRLLIPCEDVQGLRDASPSDLADVEIVSWGTALHWEKLDDGCRVEALRQGIYGNERWMAGLAQRRRERLAKAS